MFIGVYLRPDCFFEKTTRSIFSELAAKNPRFRMVLKGVEQTFTMDLAVWVRVERSCNG